MCIRDSGNIAGDTNITDVDGENDDAVKRTYTNHSSPFAGIIDEFRVTNKVLTSDQIKTMYYSESNDDFIKQGIVLSESISFTDSISTADTYVRSISESISFTDDVAKSASSTQAISELISFTDDVAKARSSTQAISELISFTDDVAKTA